MHTHRFIQIDDLTTGKTVVTELMASDAARIYPAEIQSLLAQGKTVRIGDTLHLDLQAYVRINRTLPDAMTRAPRPEAPVARGQMFLVSMATAADRLADLAVSLPNQAATQARRAVQ